jgi:acetoacetate decarboxylase
MELVRSQRDILRREKHYGNRLILGDATMVMALFETDPKIVKKVLPPPLQPLPEAIGLAYVAEFHRTNFGVTYNEAALFIGAQYEGVPGNYCLSMPVTNDLAMIGGREYFGFPKKIAEKIQVKRKGRKASGVCVRRGISLIQIDVNLTGPVDASAMPAPQPNYLFKSFVAPSLSGFDYNPRLVRQYNDVVWGEMEIGEGKISIGKSKYDPIHEIPIKQVTMAGFAKGVEIRMKPSEVVAEIDAKTYLPYSFIKFDWEL